MDHFKSFQKEVSSSNYWFSGATVDGSENPKQSPEMYKTAVNNGIDSPSQLGDLSGFLHHQRVS